MQSGREIIRDPTFLPHKIPQYALNKLHLRTPWNLRLVSVLCAAAAALATFLIIRNWHSQRIAILTTIMILTSSWLLGIGRLATPEASYLLLLPLTSLAFWLYTTKKRRFALAVLTAMALLGVYIPGFGWFLLALVIWQRRKILDEFSHAQLWLRIACGFLIVLMLTPAIWAIIQTPRLSLTFLGLPQHLISPLEFLKNLANIPIALLVRAEADPVYRLGRLPLLDAFSTVMALVGLYSFRYSWRLIRVKLILGSLVALGLLTALGGPITINAMLPFVYILIGAGLAFMLQQWFVVFPRNPVARYIGTGLLAIVVLLTAFYHISRYYVAWPQTPETKAVFLRQQ